MVQGVHSAGITGDDGAMVEGGVPVGYVLSFPDGLTVYQAGDTDVFSDMALIGEIDPLDVAVLPIGDFYTMGPKRAAHAVRLLKAPQVLCGHFGTFPALAGTPAALRELVGDGVDIPDISPGDRLG
jgi:L-ascorbate metabolism protein UlaG (beta-lactamase superfamily)